ncbi:chalcone and stilbene synthase domain-containing protein [Microdochium trichocladiopsis]|uniref:Chalcone and stilbene synthase domain-containing protein n=1 Tax=Microdochium trichocladiopsis TaxID=1682393 RepID=A0A9P9BM44_9PEZI|nr:chalcone and stilbene synthase domain-containing protein [Microdochium trichocladiopsis]KAH7029243.1 chalcone and stilbene synthase domain-containing protein [Microdochium trichocladiopsis]
MALPTPTNDPQLSIIGIGVQYPPSSLAPVELSKLAKKHYPDSPSMSKVLAINEQTGILRRSSVVTVDHPLLNQATPATIDRLHKFYMSRGVPLAVTAARKAVAEARIRPSDITHIVSTTCTNSANPGYDHAVSNELGLVSSVEKILLHGVGCSGGLAALRTAANLALAHSFRSKPARILCVALEVNTTLARSELESIHNNQEARIGVCLFSDGASAVILSNGLGGPIPFQNPVYSLLDWHHELIPNSQQELGFDVDPMGWKVTLSPAVPALAVTALQSSLDLLLSRASTYLPSQYKEASDFDWAIHPGGAKILVGAQKALSLSPEHMRASYDIYQNHGNSSSATIFSILDRHRHADMDQITPDGRVREHVVSCAFGPGITIETCILKRHGVAISSSGIPTPPDSKSGIDFSDRDEDLELFRTSSSLGGKRSNWCISPWRTVRSDDAINPRFTSPYSFRPPPQLRTSSNWKQKIMLLFGKCRSIFRGETRLPRGMTGMKGSDTRWIG